MATTKDETQIVECGFCGVKVLGKVHGDYGFYVGDMDMPEQWRLVECTNCRRPNVVGLEYYGAHGGREEWGDWRVYPPRGRVFGPEVPALIRDSFEEASNDMRIGSHMSTALMCRRTLEVLAVEHGATKGDLAKKLETLLQDGVIDKTLYDWADALRLAGNDAAHQADPNYGITKEDAEDLLSFTEAIIDFVYIFKARFAEFKKRRPTRARAPQTAASKDSRRGRTTSEGRPPKSGAAT